MGAFQEENIPVEWEAKFRSQYLFADLCSQAEILQDWNLHNYVCGEAENLIWRTFGSIIPYLRMKACSKCSFLRTKIIITSTKCIYKYPELINKQVLFTQRTSLV